MTFQEFRSDPERVMRARKALQSKELREMLALMAENNPGNRIVAADISATFSNIKLGHVAGWFEYHEALLSLGTHPPQQQMIESEYKDD